jgi:uncharacterized protein (DUF3084 family)
VEAIERMKKW